MKKSLIILFFSICYANSASSQVLISLLFGEALNSEKIEFGLTGGFNHSNFNGILETKGLNHFNLGFYFHLMLQENSFISTGVLMKSNLGATGMTPYEIGDSNLDDIFQEGVLTTKVSSFLIPVMWQQRIKQRILLEGGFQAGVRTRVFDEFEAELANGAAAFSKGVKNEYYRMDAGLIGGAGYKLSKERKSMSIGMTYYYGLVDVRIDPNITSKNSSLNVYVRIPMGAGAIKD
jgi:hypothetical protein